MSRSFSWIDPSAFSAALSRAGFDAEQAWSRRQAPAPAQSGFFPAPSSLPFSHGPGAAPAPSVQPMGGIANGGFSSPAPVPAPNEPGSSASPPATPGAAVSGDEASVPTNQAADAGAPPTLTFESPRLDLRLSAYMEWVETNTGCKGLFIVDEEGLVLMEQESDPNLVALSAYFLNLKDRIPDNLGTRSEGSIAIDLDDERVLHVVQAETHLGPHALGFTVKSPLNRDTTQAFQETLSLVFAQA